MSVTRFEKLANGNYETVRVHFALGMLYTDFKEFHKAAMQYRGVLEVV